MRFGMLLFTWGLFKKVVIADRLGLYVDSVYNDVHAFTGLPLLLATYTYAFQIYMDFSGYTDMALGSARLFNINLTRNFNAPYLATSVADFWRRWHITFSRWILDYIFKPLQMQWRNWKNWGSATALISAFLVSGIWHGASWGFVIWGGLHGIFMTCSVFYKPYQKKLHKRLGFDKTWLLKAWQIFVTFNLVSVAWVFFRANNVGDAIYVLSNIFNWKKGQYSGFLLSKGIPEIAVILPSLCAIAMTRYLLSTHKKAVLEDYISDKSVYFRWTFYVSLSFSIILCALCANSNFIYNKF